jgi:hypothetical protein
MTTSWVIRSTGPAGKVDSSRPEPAHVGGASGSADVAGIATQPGDEDLERLDVLDGLVAEMLVALLQPFSTGLFGRSATERTSMASARSSASVSPQVGHDRTVQVCAP